MEGNPSPGSSPASSQDPKVLEHDLMPADGWFTMYGVQHSEELICVICGMVNPAQGSPCPGHYLTEEELNDQL